MFARCCAVREASTSTANANAIPGGKARNAICDTTSARCLIATVTVTVRTESAFARSVSKGNSVPKVSGFTHKRVRTTRTLARDCEWFFVFSVSPNVLKIIRVHVFIACSSPQWIVRTRTAAVTEHASAGRASARKAGRA